MSLDPCYACKFSCRPVDWEPCSHCSDVYLETGTHPSFERAKPCESCHWDGVIGQDPTNWESPTNADRIRGMSDEELAELFWSRTDCGLCELRKEYCHDDCGGTWLNWLKAPVEEVDNG